MAENMTHNIKEQTWPAMFAKAWISAITGVNKVSSFTSTVKHPFNPQAIPEDAFLASSASLEVQMTETVMKSCLV